MREWLAFQRERFATWAWPGDLFGGITTAIVSLPLALAFGVASGAGAQAGLAGAVVVGLVAALAGGSRVLISEPTGPMTVMVTAVIMSFTARDPEKGLAMAMAAVFVAGATQAALGAFRLGRYITLLPYSVISGFMSGIGLLLILLQIYPLAGHPVPTGGGPAALRGLPHLAAGLHLPELTLGLGSLAVLFLFPTSWRRFCPPQLLVLAGGTLAAVWLFPPEAFRRIGEIPADILDWHWPSLAWAWLPSILVEGMLLGLLGSIDTLLTAVIADSLTRQRHDSNRELLGQGLANACAALCGGLPGAGATMGTVVNIQSGARSPWSGVLRAAILLGAVTFLAPLLSSVPLAVLAAIAVKVGADILDWSFLKRAHVVSPSAAFIMYGVMALTVLVDLMVAVGLGVFLANLLTIERLSRLQAASVKLIDTNRVEMPLAPEERALFERGQGRIVLLHLSGPMIFGVAQAIARERLALGGARALILDLTEVPLLSTTVALALENVVLDARAEGLQVFVCAGGGSIRARLERLAATSDAGIELCASRGEALKRSLQILGEI